MLVFVETLCEKNKEILIEYFGERERITSAKQNKKNEVKAQIPSWP